MQWIQEVCADLHLKATDTSQVIWEQGLAALDLQKYSSRVPLPWCPLPESATELSPHFSLPFLNQICVYSPICFPCHAVCHLCGIWVLHTCQIVSWLGQGSLAGEFASLHSNGHVWLRGPLSGPSCIFRAAPLSPAWPRQQIWTGIVNMPRSHWDANHLPGINWFSAALNLPSTCSGSPILEQFCPSLIFLLLESPFSVVCVLSEYIWYWQGQLWWVWDGTADNWCVQSGQLR